MKREKNGISLVYLCLGLIFGFLMKRALQVGAQELFDTQAKHVSGDVASTIPFLSTLFFWHHSLDRTKMSVASIHHNRRMLSEPLPERLLARAHDFFLRF
jgi:hypothetical protein